MQLLRVITPRGKASKLMKILGKNKARAITSFYGYGTANNAILNMLHTDQIKKEITMAIVDDQDSKKILDKLDSKFMGANSAIAYISPLFCEGEEIMPTEYVALYVIVDRHEGQKAVAIAQENGAKGATLIHGRGLGKEVKSILLNMNIEPEKDIVLMLVKKSLLATIKGAIYEKMNLEDENKGIIYSLPVTEVRGLVEQQ